jgi:hypothetical protein
MTPRQSIAVGARLFSVWLLLDAFAEGYFALLEPGGNAPAFRLALVLGLSLVWVAAALALWCFPQVLARRLLSHESDDAVAASGETAADTWFATGCALIGVWVIVSTLPPFVQRLAISWHSGARAGPNAYFLVRIGLGAYLILGARGLRKVVRWARYAGIRRPGESGHGP